MDTGSGKGAGQSSTAASLATPPASTSNAMEDPKPLELPPSNGPRPHRCEVCQRSFREIATLRKHEQLHRADRPYVCNTCGKSFLWSSNLKVHERVHTGERPYKCKICHRCFTQSNDLRRHERNVHMRGKIYGYKTAGRNSGQIGSDNPQVNLAAYQAFAMQQRALLQQALTYESYLQKAAVSSGQAAGAALYHHPGAPGMGGAGTQAMVGPPRSSSGQESATSPRSPLKMEQGDGMDHPHSRAGTLPSFSSFRPMQRSLEGLQAMSLAQHHLGTRAHHPLGDHSLQSHHNLRLTQEMMQLHHHHNAHHLNNNNSSSANNNNTANGGSGCGDSTRSGSSISNGPRGPSHGISPPPLSPHGSLSSVDREKEREVSDRERSMGDTMSDHGSIREYTERDMERRERGEIERIHSRDDSGREYDRREAMDTEHSRGSPGLISGQQRASSADPFSHGYPTTLEHGIMGHQRDPREHHNGPRALSVSALEERSSGGTRNSGSVVLSHLHTQGKPTSHPCDSVMDLSMNKSSSSPPSRTSSTASSTVEKEVNGGIIAMPPPKTPNSVGAESESEPGKRDVTTTSGTPTADSGGIHHCQHCNIFFYDYTMFHLHESLHMPYEEHPFRCPSCGTHCQDKIEFMFHTVWHVKYPHTIPNYTPFREGFLSSP